MSRRLSLLALVTIAGLLLTAGAETMAKKPPKPPPEPPPPVDTGIIYWSGSHGGVIHAMNPDGSDKTNLGLLGWPSIARHDDERWFLVLQVVDADNHYPYQDGDIAPFEPIQELFAVSESGVEIQLTDDPSIQPISRNALPRWAVCDGVEDGKVSVLAKQWVDTDGDGVLDAVGDYGLYVVLTDPDSEFAATPDGFIPVGPLKGSEYPWGWLDVGYDWSPDGEAIVFNNWVIHEKRTWWRADEVDDWDPVLLSEEALGELRWSPDGSRIALRMGVDIWTMDPYGSTWTLVIEGGRAMMRDPCWSPSGSHLLCMKETTKKGALQARDIFRATSDGDDLTNLTEDVDGYAVPLIWRSE